MQLKDRTGISCDLCGIQLRLDFLYYSLDMKQIEIFNNNRMSLDQILTTSITCSYDICPQCFDELKTRIIDNYKKMMNKRIPFVICELTNEVLKGTFEYYYCIISKVNIKMSNQPHVCVKCRNKIIDIGNLCKCGSKDFVKMAHQDVESRLIEFSICNKAFEEIKSKVEVVKKEGGQWEAK